MNALISIIVPVYNQEKYLSRCLDSILNQTYKNLEIVCVDDKSTDGSTEIIKHYVQKDSRIVYYRNTGKGVSSARNYGIERANGEYIGFVDSDDFIQPQMYEFMLRAMQENDCEMVACGYERVDGTNYRSFDYSARECRTSEFVDMYNFDKIIKNEMILSSACTKLIKKIFCKNMVGLAITQSERTRFFVLDYGYIQKKRFWSIYRCTGIITTPKVFSIKKLTGIKSI